MFDCDREGGEGDGLKLPKDSMLAGEGRGIEVIVDESAGLRHFISKKVKKALAKGWGGRNWTFILRFTERVQYG